MAAVNIALKPKYTTRRAVDKVIFNDGNYLTLTPEESAQHILSLFDTCYVALVGEDGKYYPISVDNYEEQYTLAKAGETPTVESDDSFGVKQLEAFASESENEAASNIMSGVTIANGVIAGTVIKVNIPANAGIDAIDKKGYWLMFKFDLAGATEEGYSDLKFFGTDAEVVDGDNVIYLGADEEAVSKAIIAIKGTLTVDSESGEAKQKFVTSLKTTAMYESDGDPVCEYDGQGYDTLTEALLAAMKTNGSTVVVNKSHSTKGYAAVSDGLTHTIELKNNATVTFEDQFLNITRGSTINVIGEGTLYKPGTFAGPIVSNASAAINTIYVGPNITLKGFYGMFVNSGTYECNITIDGKCITECGGVYVNGANKGPANIYFNGYAYGGWIGMYLAGNTNLVMNGATAIGGISGIEVRNGTANITNSRVEGCTDAPSMKANGNGMCSSNVGLAIAQHTTKKPISVVVTNSTVIGGASIMEGNPHNNEGCTEKMDVTIESGTFVGEVKTLDSDNDIKNFLYGGQYTVKPEDTYVANGYEVTENSNGTYNVAKK